MIATAKVLYDNDNMPSTLTTGYTVPASTTTTVTFISIANKTAASVNATVKLGSVTFVPTSPVAANSVATFDLKVPLQTGDIIEVQAGATSSIAVIIAGTEVV